MENEILLTDDEADDLICFRKKKIKTDEEGLVKISSKPFETSFEMAEPCVGCMNDGTYSCKECNEYDEQMNNHPGTNNVTKRMECSEKNV